MTQVVECLPSNAKALKSNPQCCQKTPNQPNKQNSKQLHPECACRGINTLQCMQGSELFFKGRDVSVVTDKW
jgi:hypothetical protein